MAEEVKQNKLKKIISIIVNAFIIIFFLISLFFLSITISGRLSGDQDAVTIFGVQSRVVITNSMEKCDQTDVSEYEIKDIPVNSLVFIDVVPEESTAKEEFYSKLKKGDVLTFKYVIANKQLVITHRIIEIIRNDTCDYDIYLQGDNKNSDDGVMTQEIHTKDESSPNYVIGKVTGQSIALGTVITIMKSDIGIIFIVIVPFSIIFIYELIKLIGYIKSEKKEKKDDELSKKNEELEILRKKLKELEEGRGENNDN